MSPTPNGGPPVLAADMITATLRSTGGERRARASLTPAAVSLAIMAIASALVAMATRQPGFAAMGIPAWLALVHAVWTHREGSFDPVVEVPSGPFVEGDLAYVNVTVASEVGIGRCVVELQPPSGIWPGSESLKAAMSIGAGGATVARLPIEFREWGVYSLGELVIRTTDALGLIARDYSFTVDCSLAVRLHDEDARETLSPDRYRRIVGGHLSAQRGEGTELADVREYRPGDPMKWINWRISNRRRQPWVTVRHPDRSTTVILLVDGFARRGPNLRAQANVAQALAGAHLAIHDRVGMLIAGPTHVWIEPQLGRRQEYRLADALLQLTTRHRSSDEVDLRRVIPPDALVVAITSFDDIRILRILAEIRRRGRMLSVVEPVLSADELQSSSGSPKSLPFVRRIHELEREVRRRTLRQHGLVIVPWRNDDPVSLPLGTIARYRQRSAVKA